MAKPGFIIKYAVHKLRKAPYGGHFVQTMGIYTDKDVAEAKQAELQESYPTAVIEVNAFTVATGER